MNAVLILWERPPAPENLAPIASECRKKRGVGGRPECLGMTADMIVVSCITCLMYLDNVQQDLNKADGNGTYEIPVFDYNQLLALCMGHPAAEVARIATMPRERITERFA